MLTRTVLAVTAIAISFAAFGADSAIAARPDRTSSSTISLVVLSATDAAATTARYGDEVTFSISTTATEYPFVSLRCYQDGVLVAEGWAGFFDGALGDRNFTLWSPAWSGGAADCTAAIQMHTKRGSWKQLATTSFHVSE